MNGRGKPLPNASASGPQETGMERRIINPWTWQDALGFVQANDVSGAL